MTTRVALERIAEEMARAAKSEEATGNEIRAMALEVWRSVILAHLAEREEEKVAWKLEYEQAIRDGKIAVTIEPRFTSEEREALDAAKSLCASWINADVSEGDLGPFEIALMHAYIRAMEGEKP